MLTEVLSIARRIEGKKILVIGDIMVDEYIFGTAERISPEAPVPVVLTDRREVRLGGAANVVANLRGLGVEAMICGFVGNDAEGDLILRDLGPQALILRSRAGSTTVKKRVIASGQQIVRVDREEYPSPKEQGALLESLAQDGVGFDWIILSDYRKGVITDSVVEWAVRTYAPSVSVDSKREDLSVFRGCAIVTPNVKEAERAVGYVFRGDEEALFASKELLEKAGTEAILLTRGKDGMILVENEVPGGFRIPAVARNVFDVTGAGDTVIATITAALAAGASRRQAAILSGIAASVVVGEIGTSAITSENLIAAISTLRRREFRPYEMVGKR